MVDLCFSGDRCGDAVGFSLFHKAAMQRTPASQKGSAENRGNCCQRKHPAEILALGPSCASHRRSSNASAAGIRLDHRKSVRPFKGIIWDHISEFEYSHAVGLSASPLVSVGGAFRLASPLSRIDSQRRKARRLASPADRENFELVVNFKPRKRSASQYGKHCRCRGRSD